MISTFLRTRGRVGGCWPTGSGFSRRLGEAVLRCRKISEPASQQLQLDASAVRSLLLSFPSSGEWLRGPLSAAHAQPFAAATLRPQPRAAPQPTPMLMPMICTHCACMPTRLLAKPRTHTSLPSLDQQLQFARNPRARIRATSQLQAASVVR